MAATEPGTIFRHLRASLATAGFRDVPDGELLERFVGSRDEGAFAALVNRHGGMVWGVCRRYLRDSQDAEDAWQATFLVLAGKAGSVRKRPSVGSWLHGVASQTARGLRAKCARRRAAPPVAAGQSRDDPAVEASWRETLSILDEELGRLPEGLRAPLVLCYLEGRARDEAARQLGCAPGVFRGRLQRGRELLRARLARRGLSLSAGLLAVVLPERPASAGAPPALVRAAVTSAVSFAAGKPAARLLSPQAATLTEGVMKAMQWTRPNVVLFLSVALAVVTAAGAGVFYRGAPTGPGAVAPRERRGEPAANPPRGPGDPRKAHIDPGVWRQIGEAADKVEDPMKRAWGLVQVAKMQGQVGDRAASLKTLGQALKAAEAIPGKEPHRKFTVLGLIAVAQADLGDDAGARKTLEALKAPPGGADPEDARAMTLANLARAWARAGKVKEGSEAAEAVRRPDSKDYALMNVAAAQAKAGDWKGALKTAGGIRDGGWRSRALRAVARLQAKAGDSGGARKSLKAALQIAEGMPAKTRKEAEDRAWVLAQVARAQADLGDAAGGLKTVKSIADYRGKVLGGKQYGLVLLKARAADFRGALAVAKTAPSVDGARDGLLAVIAAAQAQAKDFPGAATTLERMKTDRAKARAAADLGRAAARSGRSEEVAKALGQALEHAKRVPQDSWVDDREYLLESIAAAQAEAGDDKGALAWAAEEPSPYGRLWALLGVAKGAAARRGTTIPLGIQWQESMIDVEGEDVP